MSRPGLGVCNGPGVWPGHRIPLKAITVVNFVSITILLKYEGAVLPGLIQLSLFPANSNIRDAPRSPNLITRSMKQDELRLRGRVLGTGSQHR